MRAGLGSPFDALVIGSGIGGLACACALTRMGYRVLVLERHFAAGFLTQSFSRDGFTWAISTTWAKAAPRGRYSTGCPARRSVLHRPAPGYDTVHLPGGARSRAQGAGLTGAMMGGVLSAATAEPRVLAHVT